MSDIRFKYMKESTLWELCKTEGHPDALAARDEIARRYYQLVIKVAHKKHAGTPYSVALAELQSDAQMGLLDAITRFDPSNGATFGAWAYLKMTGHMQDGLRKLGSLKSAPITKADVPIEFLDSQRDWSSDVSALAVVTRVKEAVLEAVLALPDDELDFILDILTDERLTADRIRVSKLATPEAQKIFDKLLAMIEPNDEGVSNG